MISPLFLPGAVSVSETGAGANGQHNAAFFELLQQAASNQPLSEKSSKISLSSEIALAAKEQKQTLVQDFLNHLMRHGLSQMSDKNEEASGYLSEPFRVKGSSVAELKMDALLDQAAVMRQLFAVIAEQREAAKARLEAHWEERAETSANEKWDQSQLDQWEQWLREQVISSTRSL